MASWQPRQRNWQTQAGECELAAELRETDARLQVATDELGKSLGLTQKQLDARAAEIVEPRRGRHQAAGDARSSRPRNR